MRDIKKNKNKKTVEYKFISFVFSLAVIFLIVFLIISNLRIYQRRIDLKNQIREKEVEIKELSEKIKNIEKSEGDNIDDDFRLEKIAREQLLLKKRGEEVVYITIPEETEEEIAETERSGLLLSLKNFYIIVKDKFFNFFNK